MWCSENRRLRISICLFLLLYCRCAKVLLSQLVVRFLTTLHCLCTWMVSMSWVPPPLWSTRPKKGNTPSLVRTKVFFCLSNLMKPFSLPSDLDFLQFLMRLVLDRPRGGLCHLWWVLIKRLCFTLVVDCHIKKVGDARRKIWIKPLKETTYTKTE